MPPRNQKKSKAEGLYKRCKHLSWDKCACPWWGRVRRQRVSLEKWSLTPVKSKEMAKKVFARMESAVLGGTFDKRGEHAEQIADNGTFGDFLDDYKKYHIEADKLRSNSVDSYLATFRTKFGKEQLRLLAGNPSTFERWLNELQQARKWENATFNRYIQHGHAMFNWAKRRKIVSENPFDVLNKRRENNKRDNRISPDQEQKLLDACDSLDAIPASKSVKVSSQTLAEIRRRAEAGELQKDIAESLGLSRPLICQIVNERIWSPDTRRRSASSEMKRRLIAALDLGLRQGEMLLLQVKHVDYDEWRVNLPASMTKAQKDQYVYAETPRVQAVLTERRALGPAGYIFGRESGAYVQSFDKLWHRLFIVAGLQPGRKGGYVWHDIRHEFCSDLADKGATIQELKQMARHSDIRTTARYLTAREERLRELARTRQRSA